MGKNKRAQKCKCWKWPPPLFQINTRLHYEDPRNWKKHKNTTAITYKLQYFNDFWGQQDFELHTTDRESTPRTITPAGATRCFYCRPKFSCWSEGEDAVWRESSVSVHTRAQSLKEPQSEWNEIRSTSSNSATRDATEEPLTEATSTRPGNPRRQPPLPRSVSHLADLYYSKHAGSHTHHALKVRSSLHLGYFSIDKHVFCGLRLNHVQTGGQRCDMNAGVYRQPGCLWIQLKTVIFMKTDLLL